MIFSVTRSNSSFRGVRRNVSQYMDVKLYPSLQNLKATFAFGHFHLHRGWGGLLTIHKILGCFQAACALSKKEQANRRGLRNHGAGLRSLRNHGAGQCVFLQKKRGKKW